MSITIDRKVMNEKANKQESQAQVNKRIANNYPSIKSVFYTIFMSAHINDVREVESAVRALGNHLNSIGILPLWDDVNVNINSKTIELRPQEDELMRFSWTIRLGVP